MKRLLLVVVVLTFAGCASLPCLGFLCPGEHKDCRKTGCDEGQTCENRSSTTAYPIWECGNPTPQPTPTPAPVPDCKDVLCPDGTECKDGKCVPRPTPEPTPAPTPTPTPAPTPTPEPTPTPTPVPTPGELCACKPFVRWGLAKPGSSSSKWLKDGRQVSGPVLGGVGYFDSVQRFGSGNGQACDSDHPDNCRCPDGRVPECEDRRGPVWSLEGPGRLFVEGEWGFQARVQLSGRGHYKLKVCPRNPLLDGHGREVVLAPGNCGTFEWDVR